MYLAILSATQHLKLEKRVSAKLRTVAGLILAAVNVAMVVGCASETQSSALLTSKTQILSPVTNKTQSQALLAIKTPIPIPAPVTHKTQSPAIVATKTKTKFYIYQDASSPENHYTPTGYMGDVGDIQMNEAFEDNPHSGKTSIQVVYQAQGNSPNKCEYSPPCKWAGVYWQEPRGNWGTKKEWKGKGFDLSSYNRLVFWARAERNTKIEFKVGGINKPYGDSLTDPRSIKANLTQGWQEFEIDLKGADLKHIIGGFVWATNQNDNPNGVKFYLDDIRFEKK